MRLDGARDAGSIAPGGIEDSATCRDLSSWRRLPSEELGCQAEEGLSFGGTDPVTRMELEAPWMAPEDVPSVPPSCRPSPP